MKSNVPRAPANFKFRLVSADLCESAPRVLPKLLTSRGANILPPALPPASPPTRSRTSSCGSRAAAAVIGYLDHFYCRDLLFKKDFACWAKLIFGYPPARTGTVLLARLLRLDTLAGTVPGVSYFSRTRCVCSELFEALTLSGSLGRTRYHRSLSFSRGAVHVNPPGELKLLVVAIFYLVPLIAGWQRCRLTVNA